MTNELNNFVEAFFKKINAETSWEGEKLHVKNVPKSFETFYGKRSPYVFVFSGVHSGEEEYISKESFLIKSIAEFLDNRGKLSVLKILDECEVSETLKRFVAFRNAEIIKKEKDIEYKNLIRYSFLSSVQYLNESDKTVNHFYFMDGKIIDFKHEKYKYGDIKNVEIDQDEIKKGYEIAKEEVKKALKAKIDVIGKRIQPQLNNEIERIQRHYEKLGLEKLKAIEDNENAITSLKKKNKPENEQKIERHMENIKKLREEYERERIKHEGEKIALIEDEKKKYSLNVKNSLMNTAIIKIPLYNFRIFLKSDKGNMKYLEIPYDLIGDELKIRCESSGVYSKEFYLCSGGQICSPENVRKCKNCESFMSKSEEKIVSEISGREICNNCAVRCSECKRKVSVQQTEIDEMKNKICNQCIRNCASCRKKYGKSRLVQCGNCKNSVCKNCIKKKFINMTAREVCGVCFK